MRVLSLLLAAAALPALAADPTPEITRGQVTPQAVNAMHTLRQIPEACARLEGMFTGDAAQPYRFVPVKSSPRCQPRARFVDAAKVKPSEADGWKFNDLIRVPNAGCLTQLAVVRVWRHPADVAPPELDAQGRARIYLKDSVDQAKAKKLPPVPMYAASMAIEGMPCGG